jgi:NAD(P)-dependent dehydrogenase (short-subunit alcohol dehydrogenase family)
MTETQRVAIVTGAAGGIGRAMTRGLLAAGIRVAGVDRDREPLETLAAMAREQEKAAELLTIQTDLSSDSAADEITRATRAQFGRIDILVNNAGIGPGAIRRIVGSARSNSGRSRQISGAALSRCTRRRRGRSQTPSCPR